MFFGEDSRMSRRALLAKEAATDVRRGILRVSRLLAASVPRGGLSQMKLSALASLNRDGDVNASGLSGRMTVRPQSLTRILAELETAGLITRTRAAEDERA